MNARLFPAAVVLVFLVAGCVDAPAPAGPAATDEPDKPNWVAPALPKIPAKVGLANLSSFVTKNPYRAEDTAEHKAARDYLAKEFAAAGLEVWRHDFTNGIKQQNVCGLKLGVGKPAEWVIVGGHYDTTTWDAIATGAVGQGAMAPGRLVSQGAYDDGSGTWIAVELGKAFAGVPSYYSIMFCGFDGEERGLEGSAALKKELENGDLFPHPFDDTHAVLDFDMFGICYPVRTPISMTTSSQKLSDSIDGFRKGLKVPDDMYRGRVSTSGGGSDYGTWIGQVPTVFFISDMGSLGVPTPVPQSVTPATPAGSYPWWHWQDTMESMTLMAGGPDMLTAAFQTAFDLSTQTLAVMAWEPGALNATSG